MTRWWKFFDEALDGVAEVGGLLFSIFLTTMGWEVWWWRRGSEKVKCVLTYWPESVVYLLVRGEEEKAAGEGEFLEVPLHEARLWFLLRLSDKGYREAEAYALRKM